MIFSTLSLLKPPIVACRRLDGFDKTDLASVRRAFGSAPACALGQAWLAAAQLELRPATVRFGFSVDALFVFAELEDDDIYSKASRLNERAWELGDSLEIFLHAEGASSYAEFHVTPGNQRLQMRIPIPRPKERPPEEMMVPGELFDSSVWIEAGRWRVLASIPFASSEGRPTSFSVSRYDYTRGRPEPVLSSTSPHARCDFHRREEWGALRYA